MEACVPVLVFAILIGQSSAQRVNQPINNQLGFQGRNYVNNDGNVANQLNSLLRQQVQQQNLVRQFKQDQYAQQNLAGAAVQQQNVQPQVVSAQAVGAEPGAALNQPIQTDQARKSQINVNQIDPTNQSAGVARGVVKPAVNTLQARVANTGYVRPDQLSRNNQQNPGIQLQGNLQDNQNQQLQQNQNQVNQQNPNNQNNQFQNNQNPVLGQAQPVNQVNSNYNEVNKVTNLNQGVVKESVLVPGIVTAAPVLKSDVDSLAEDDRQKSSRLEQHVDTHDNNNNNNNNNNIPGIITADNKNDGVVNQQPVNNIFNGGGVKVNVPDNNYQRQP